LDISLNKKTARLKKPFLGNPSITIMLWHKTLLKSIFSHDFHIFSIIEGYIHMRAMLDSLISSSQDPSPMEEIPLVPDAPCAPRLRTEGMFREITRTLLAYPAHTPHERTLRALYYGMCTGGFLGVAAISAIAFCYLRNTVPGE
jgi:hypothetical protein